MFRNLEYCDKPKGKCFGFWSWFFIIAVIVVGGGALLYFLN